MIKSIMDDFLRGRGCASMNHCAVTNLGLYRQFKYESTRDCFGLFVLVLMSQIHTQL